ncbi:hypothetical protein Rsub_03230 [Raphidocelis subcapitata]|uniref:Tetratricopeptide repeat protein n=1 Tax=Raphidocelis subcapitata TaxID=307507 RepID=A0A2V0NSK8_9CHLO|nr:hypothetical protein Rsub_03230 [Raphidocelis subcapitata]|eukprot:GBF90658.1 hypothetical protein Rsub_03230 [Raphidocelis subcapitata]
MEHARSRELRVAARTALQRRQWARARELLDDALDAAPDAAGLYRLRIIASAGLGDFESALEDADALLELRPGPDAWMYRGHALYHLHEFAAAAHAFQNGLRASPCDRLMTQGWWDALTMLRQEPPASVTGHGGGGGGDAAAGRAGGGRPGSQLALG